MYFYQSGRKFNYELNSNGKMSNVVQDEMVTVIDGVEHNILNNAPLPFTYGVKNICISYYGSLCTIYNVLTNEYSENVPFRGEEWLHEHKFFPPADIPIEHLELDDTIILPKEEV